MFFFHKSLDVNFSSYCFFSPLLFFVKQLKSTGPIPKMARRYYYYWNYYWNYWNYWNYWKVLTLNWK